jgi:hypothetical protein
VLLGGELQIAGNLERAGIPTVGVFLSALRERADAKTLRTCAPALTQAGLHRYDRNIQNQGGVFDMRVVDVLQEKRFPVFCNENSKGQPQHVGQCHPVKSLPGDFTPLGPIFCNRSG